MKGFARLVIENFQSHERTEVEFADGLNVFVGPSDSGKSAILRALRWVLYNQPKGKDYIRAGKDRCRVTLTLTDGTEILRERSASINRYTLKRPGEESMVFEGFGGNVPREVMEAHRMHPLKLDSDWNMPAQFGTQLEGPFLLSETGGVKAKSIGRVSGAHWIDIALQGTVRDTRSLSSQMKHDLQESARLQDALTPYESLPQLLERLEGAEGCHREAARMQKRLQRLEAARGSWSICRARQAEERSRLARLARLPELEALAADLERICVRRQRLERSAESRRRTLRETAEWTRLMEETGECARLERELRRLQESAARNKRLERLRERRDVHRRDEEKVRRWLKVTESIREADLSDLDESHRHLIRLERILPRWRRVRTEQEKLQERLSRTESLPEETAAELNGKLERLKRLQQCADDLKDRRQRMSEGVRYRAAREREIRACTERLAGILEAMGRCPTCGSPIDGSAMEHILEEYRGGVSGAAAGRADQRD